MSEEQYSTGTENDLAAANVLSGATFGSDASLTLPSGLTLDSSAANTVVNPDCAAGTREFGPIETAPWCLFPPYDAPADIGQDMQAALREALRGVELGEYDARILEWLAGWDVSTVAVVVSWIERVRAAGAR